MTKCASFLTGTFTLQSPLFSGILVKSSNTAMEVNTLSFEYGNLTTFVGFFGVVSTFIVLLAVFRSYFTNIKGN
jgi:hypothetical protein